MKMNNMKISIKIWLVISSLLILISLYGIFNTQVTLSYEVYEPLAMGKASETLKARAEDLKSIIFWLWVIIGYAAINIVFLTVFLKKMRKQLP